MFMAVAPEELKTAGRFWRTVTFYVPSENGSGQSKVDFKVQYAPLPKDEEKAALERLKSDDDYEDEWFKEHVVGFRDVVDASTKTELPFEDAFRRVQQYSPARQATMRAYHAAMTGQKGNG